MINDDFEQLSPSSNLEGGESSEKNIGPSLKARAIDFLSRREHSRLELQRKLQRHSDDLFEINSVLDQLAKGNWQSDERFAQSHLNRRQDKFGSSRLLYELRQHGVEPDSLVEIQEQLQETELQRARAVWQRKFNAPPADQKEWAKQYRFMISRGFAPNLLRRIIDSVDDSCI